MISYEYDETGRKTGIIYPDGTKTSYAYDKNDNLLEVKAGLDVTTYQYDALGNKTQTLLPNGMKTIYEYDAINQLTKLESTKASGEVMTSMTYTYDALGNIKTSVENIEGIITTKEYTYDEEERLLSSKHVTNKDTKEYVYTYDRVGNKVSVEESINGKKTKTQYEFDNNNALVSEEGEMGVDYSYDDNGNVIGKRYTNGIIEGYSYNAKGQLIEIQSSNGKTITYSYDGFGNRIEKQEITTISQSEDSPFLEIFSKEGSFNEDYDQQLAKETTKEKLSNLGTTIEEHSKTYDQTCKSQNMDGEKTSIKTIAYINDINRDYVQVVQTENSTGDTLDTYIYGNERISTFDTYETAYYSYDGKGSVIGHVTNSHVDTLSYQVEYDDYGKTNRKMDDSYGYNGEYHDYNDSQYLRARYYDTSTGTFQQEDSYLGELERPISQNRYAYGHNNPIKHKDPSGHYIVFDDSVEDTVSKTITAKQKAGQTTTWDKEIENFFNKNKHWDEAAYKHKAEQARIEAEAFNRNYIKGLVNGWEGEAGEVGRKYFESLMANGLSYEETYKLALQIKKICDQLDSEQMGMVKKHVDSMDVNSTELIDFFGWRTATVEGNHLQGTEGTSRDIIYSYFTNFLNTNRSSAQTLNEWLMLFGVIMTSVTVAVATYQSMMLLALVTGDMATYYQMASLPSVMLDSNKESGSAFGDMSFEDQLRYDRWIKEVQDGWTAEQRYNYQMYGNPNGLSWDGGYIYKQPVDSNIHGNSLDYEGLNYGYVLYDKETGEILKFGESIDPNNRYTQSFLNSKNANMAVVNYGSKVEVHNWQNMQINNYFDVHGHLPPLNNNFW
ncbi:MAG: RHS repeat-associated core domain-containing protein [Coprobacillaceae bacterium]